MRLQLAPLGLAVLLLQPVSLYAQSAVPGAVPPSTVTGASPALPPLTLAAAIERAFQYNPGLRSARQDVAIAQGQRIQAGKSLNPALTFVREGLRSSGNTTTIQVNQEIELGGKRAARIASADLDQAAASADVATYRANLRADVVTAYFDVLSAQERLALARASQQLSERVTAAAARRVLAGRISPVEETRARVAQASTKIELSQASTELALARQRLAATWGNKLADVAPVAVPTEALASHQSTAQLLAQLSGAPQLLRARIEVERQKSGVELERSRRMPNVTLSLGSKRDEQAGIRQTVVGIAVPLPLFDRNQGNVLSALRRTDKAKDDVAVVQANLSLELTQASLRREAASNELTVLRDEILPGAQHAYESATKGFELGKFSFLDVLDAQRTLNQSKALYIGALAQSHRAAADIERLVGNVEQHGRLLDAAISPQEQE
ncbi:TolC family protein [Massilia sp. DWR3-1-1]|uniref:TolC family protein n=1 Tax=Massilia sp. DWR3-1-1 TaxID=2804559 RepID=UPI003CF6DBF7